MIGTDATNDFAFLKIEAKDLSPIPFGDSDDIKVGEWVLAVGNPFGFTSTVTAGIVSAKARSISSATHSMPMGVESFIQTDAAVIQETVVAPWLLPMACLWALIPLFTQPQAIMPAIRLPFLQIL